METFTITLHPDGTYTIDGVYRSRLYRPNPDQWLQDAGQADKVYVGPVDIHEDKMEINIVLTL